MKHFPFITIINFGAVTPAVFNFHLRKWMAYKCKIPNFIDVPTQGGLGVDYLNFAVTIVGVICLGENFGTEANIFDKTIRA